MEFFDLKIQYQRLKKEIDAAVLKTLESGVFIGGPEVDNFEKETAAFFGVKHAIGLNSGTDALYLALRAMEIGAGDEVLVPAFTFIATAEAVARCGATPVFVDIDPITFNIDPGKIKEKITGKTKAIIPVHLYGRAADMGVILKIAKDNKLFVIEDAAQAMGTKYGGKYCGAMGDIGCLSFFPTKNLGAFGDGGMALTNSDEIANKIKLLRAHGSSPGNKYLHLALGINSRLDAVQAAILRVKLPHLDEFILNRIKLANGYNEGFAGVGDIVLPQVTDDFSCAFHQYTIRLARRDELQKFLKENGIPTMIYLPIPLHLLPAFAYLGYEPGNFPESERASREVISLPIYPEFEKNNQDIVIGAIKIFINR